MKELSVGVLYYTGNDIDEKLLTTVQEQIKKGINNYKLVSVSLKPIKFGHNIVLPLERCYLTLFKQILIGLETLDTDIVFLTEHDVLYHPSHFTFRPEKKNIYYYDSNIWHIRQSDGFAVTYRHKILSQLCAYREQLIIEYKERVRKTELYGYIDNGIIKNGLEPGTRSIKYGGYNNNKSEFFTSEYPSIDIRHDKNFSVSKWSLKDFKYPNRSKGWTESNIDRIDGWTNLKELINL